LGIDNRIEILPENIIDFEIEEDQYGIISQILHLMHPDQITKVLNKIKSSLIKGGMVFISVPTERHYAIDYFKKRFQVINERSFYDENGKDYFHFFSREELLQKIHPLIAIHGPESHQIQNDEGFDEIYEFMAIKE